MHRHSYQGRKLSLERDQRKALLRGMATSLILHEQITTTLAKAKEVAPFFEHLVTKAKQGDLVGERSVREVVLTENAALKLLRELTPAFGDRSGGYTRIVKAGHRRGDNAPMAILALVLPEKLPVADTTEKSADTESAKPAKKSANVNKKSAPKTKVAS